MQTKRYEYHYKDVPAIKKDIAVRVVFALLFFAIFFWQITSTLINFRNNGGLSTIELTMSIYVLLMSAVMGLIALLYANKDLKILNQIHRRGKAVRPMTPIFKIDKTSFARLYSVINFIITIAMIAVLACGITMFVLELVYYSTISYYLPLLVLLSLCGLNSVYHIRNEMKIMKNVQEFSRAY